MNETNVTRVYDTLYINYIYINKKNLKKYIYVYKILLLTILNTHIEQVHYFNYLGSKITEDGRSKDDIINRISQAKSAFPNKNIY